MYEGWSDSQSIKQNCVTLLSQNKLVNLSLTDYFYPHPSPRKIQIQWFFIVILLRMAVPRLSSFFGQETCVIFVCEYNVQIVNKVMTIIKSKAVAVFEYSLNECMVGVQQRRYTPPLTKIIWLVHTTPEWDKGVYTTPYLALRICINSSYTGRSIFL